VGWRALVGSQPSRRPKIKIWMATNNWNLTNTLCNSSIWRTQTQRPLRAYRAPNVYQRAGKGTQSWLACLLHSNIFQASNRTIQASRGLTCKLKGKCSPRETSSLPWAATMPTSHPRTRAIMFSFPIKTRSQRSNKAATSRTTKSWILRAPRAKFKQPWARREIISPTTPTPSTSGRAPRRLRP